MKAIYALFVASLLLSLHSYGGNYSKSCSDGVCTINDNGKISYTGDRRKIKAIKDKKKSKVAQQKSWSKRWKKAEKKPKGEVIRVAIMRPTSSDPGLRSLAKAYHKMIIDQYKNKPGIEVVPWDKIKGKLKMLANSDDDDEQQNSRFSQRNKPKKGKYELYATKDSVRDMRNFSLPADFVVFTHLSTKSKTGIMRGSKLKEGAVIKVNNVEFLTTTTPVYKFKPKEVRHMGKSTDGVQGASWKKGSKSRKGTFKSKRAIKHDGPAIAGAASHAQRRILKWQPHLPSHAASEKIYAAQKKEMFGDMPEGMAQFAEAITENGGEVDKKTVLKQGFKSLFGK